MKFFGYLEWDEFVRQEKEFGDYDEETMRTVFLDNE